MFRLRCSTFDDSCKHLPKSTVFYLLIIKKTLYIIFNKYIIINKYIDKYLGFDHEQQVLVRGQEEDQRDPREQEGLGEYINPNSIGVRSLIA